LPEYGAQIKIRDLLEGQSKFRSYGELFALALHDPNLEEVDSRVFEMIARQKGLGSGPSLNSVNDTELFLLSKLVERTIGISLARLIQEQSFLPSSMQDTIIGEGRDGKQRHAVFTTLRDVAKSHKRFGAAATYRRDGQLNPLAPAWYPLNSGALIGLCNAPDAPTSTLTQKAGAMILPLTKDRRLGVPGGEIGGVMLGPSPMPPPTQVPNGVTARFHSPELDMDLVLDAGVLKLVRPDGGLTTYGELRDPAHWWGIDLRFIREGIEVTAIVVGTGWSIKDIRFDRIP